jgi:hypothetical protein
MWVDGVTYRPSRVEAEWLSTPSDGFATWKLGKICSLTARRSQTNATPHWLRFAKDFAGSAPREPTAEESDVLSRFEGRGCTEFIEPLTGLGRHPWAQSLGCKGRWPPSTPPNKLRNKYSIDHLVIANHCGGSAQQGKRERCGGDERLVAPYGRCRSESILAALPTTRTTTRRSPCCTGGRNLFFDLGCSVYGRQASLRKGIATGSGLGTSLQLFTALYSKNCIDFDRLFAWEAHAYEPQAWWKYVPARMRARLTFFNVPVTTGMAPNDPGNFLSLLNETATPDDFVVVKIDIDTPDIEARIVRAIADNPAWAVLVDELFFEYHYHWIGGHSPHGNSLQNTNRSAPNYVNATVDDAMSLMHKLRAQGVRSHFWV